MDITHHLVAAPHAHAPGVPLGTTGAPADRDLPTPARRWSARQSQHSILRVCTWEQVPHGCPSYDLRYHTIPWGDVVLEYPHAPTLEGWVWAHTTTAQSQVWPRTRGEWVALCDRVREEINVELITEYTGEGRSHIDGYSQIVVDAHLDHTRACDALTGILTDEVRLDQLWRECLSPAE